MEHSISFILTIVTISFLISQSILEWIFLFFNKLVISENVKKEQKAFGGITIILSLVCVSLILPDEFFHIPPNIIFFGLLFFLLGFIDDKIKLSVTVKIVSEVIIIVFVIIQSEVDLSNLNGFLNLNEISTVSSLIIASFIILFLVNSFNLLDGIDGLAASIALVALLIFSFFFYSINSFDYLTLTLILIGSLISFLSSNIIQSQRQIILGDNGSLLIGYLLSILSIKLMSYSDDLILVDHEINCLPLFLFLIFIIPIFDVIRIIFIRLKNKKNPLIGDLLHIHHVLKRFGLNDFQSTIIFVGTQIITIIGYLTLSSLNPLILHIYILLIFINFWVLFDYIDNYNRNRGLL